MVIVHNFWIFNSYKGRLLHSTMQFSRRCHQFFVSQHPLWHKVVRYYTHFTDKRAQEESVTLDYTWSAERPEQTHIPVLFLLHHIVIVYLLLLFKCPAIMPSSVLC